MPELTLFELRIQQAEALARYNMLTTLINEINPKIVYHNELGDLLTSARKALHLSQQQVGAAVGYGNGAGVSISRIESGQIIPKVDKIRELAKLLAIDEALLLDLRLKASIPEGTDI
jgi:ribosome-binding protein aMBF1 (putative translation factor)